MKKLLIILLSFLSTGMLIAQDMKLDELLEKYFKATGGDRLEKLQTYKITGKMFKGAEYQCVIFGKRPDMERSEAEIQGTRVIVAFIGQTGWIINPFGSPDPQDMSADMININKKQMGTEKNPFGWNNPLINWKENGNRTELIGREDIDGTPVYNIKMTLNDNEVINFYMDQEKFMILKMKDKSMTHGHSEEVEVIYTDFRNVDGLLMPYRLETFYNGSPAVVVTIDKIELNLPLDDEIFEKPVTVKK